MGKEKVAVRLMLSFPFTHLPPFVPASLYSNLRGCGPNARVCLRTAASALMVVAGGRRKWGARGACGGMRCGFCATLRAVAPHFRAAGEGVPPAVPDCVFLAVVLTRLLGWRP
ncbi:hypothetical protein JKG47_08995 [Acidithiobacillus sp. MC6.1]|nr:hypothetical protein [Acidithiobacillus sp. MC6.1]